MIDELVHRVGDAPRFIGYGRITRVVGLVLEATGLEAAIGDLCSIKVGPDRGSLLAEVVGFHERGVLLMPLGDLGAIQPGCPVEPLRRQFGVEVGPGLLGRILNGVGQPMDGRGPLGRTHRVPLAAPPPDPLERESINEPLVTGVRAVDGLLTLGRGQRVGIFAGSGVGKSTLLGMVARHTSADVNVIALLGERGREVREFIDNSLGPEGLARSVVVVATGDEAALVRARGAFVATAIAEYFRDLGKHVLLMVDSITRVAMAWREIGLAVGEPPTTKGYPPSVFAQLPRLLERAGNGAKGGISGIYTVLVDGDDFNEPIADAARGILDGHIILTRRQATAGHFPAIEVLESKSRVRDHVITDEQRQAADAAQRLLAAYREKEDLIMVGAYQTGSDPLVDASIRMRDELNSFLRQRPSDCSGFAETRQRLIALAAQAG